MEVTIKVRVRKEIQGDHAGNIYINNKLIMQRHGNWFKFGKNVEYHNRYFCGRDTGDTVLPVLKRWCELSIDIQFNDLDNWETNDQIVVWKPELYDRVCPSCQTRLWVDSLGYGNYTSVFKGNGMDGEFMGRICHQCMQEYIDGDDTPSLYLNEYKNEKGAKWDGVDYSGYGQDGELLKPIPSVFLIHRWD